MTNQNPDKVDAPSQFQMPEGYDLTYDGKKIVLGQTYYFDRMNQIHACTPVPCLLGSGKYEPMFMLQNNTPRVSMFLSTSAVDGSEMRPTGMDCSAIHSSKQSVLAARIEMHQGIIKNLVEEIGRENQKSAQP